MCHRPPVLHDVRDPRGRAEVVLEHAHATVGVSHEIDTGHVHPHTARRSDPSARQSMKMTRGDDDPPWYDAVTHDLALAVHVVEEPFERAHPLPDPALDDRPLRRGEHTRNEVEREGPLLARKRERDPLIAKDPIAARAAFVEVGARERLHVLVQRVVVDPGLAGRVEHLVPGIDRLVCVEKIAHWPTLNLRPFDRESPP